MNTICKTIGRGLFKNQSKQLEIEQGTKTQQHPKLMRAIGFGRQRTRLKMKIFVTLAFTENRTSFSCNPLGNIMKKLDPNYVLIPFQGLIGNSQNNVLMGLRLVEKIDKFPEPTAEELQFMQIYFNGHITEIKKSKSLFKDWLLKNGFEDINTAIRTTMERLFIFKSIEARVKLEPQLDYSELHKDLAIKANRENFPNLMIKINEYFDKPLDYHESMLSLNNARNCFVHRNGIVGEKDLNNGDSDKLEVIGNRFKVFFKKGEEEIIAELGKPGPENAALMLGAENFTIQFEKGQKIDFTLKQFLDIINTCVFIKSDIEVRIKE